MTPLASRRRLRWSGASALVGAVMWAYKSIVILVSGDQPDYWFELAFLWFGLSILLIVYALKDRLTRSATLLTVLAWIAALAGAIGSTGYVVIGEESVFDLAPLIATVSIIVILFLIGGDIRRDQLLPRYSFAPRLLAWLYVGSIPIGAVLSAIDERLLEIGLLGVVAGWIILALGTLNDRPIDRSAHTGAGAVS